MAIDKTRAHQLIGGIRASFDQVTGHLPERTRNWLRENVLGAAIGELVELVVEARPPVLYLLGRSGHGKSSLLNALARRHVAEVGHVRPRTPGADAHFITFEDVFAEWQVVDARGIFETPIDDGARIDPVEQAEEDIRKYRPDVILHVVTASEVRAFSNDVRVFGEIQRGIVKDLGGTIPTVMVLTKVDLLDDPEAWPPGQHPRKAALVKDLLDYVGKDVLVGEPDRIDPNTTLAGYKLTGREYAGVVPVSVLPARLWNVETLVDFIAGHLPASAILDYAQALQRKELLRRVSTRTIRRFAAAASGIGAAPVPVADIAVLTPLQVLLVALVAGLSCRRFSPEAAIEFTTATGFSVGFAFAAREGARGAVKLLPGVGSLVSGAIAGATTYGIGMSAEAYFFAGETRRPARFFPQFRRRRGRKGEDDRAIRTGGEPPAAE